jgi:hypothetical protein
MNTESISTLAQRFSAETLLRHYTFGFGFLFAGEVLTLTSKRELSLLKEENNKQLEAESAGMSPVKN